MNEKALRGLVAVGRTKQEAANRFELAALGKGASYRVSESGDLAFVTHATAANEMFNPATGNMDLIAKEVPDEIEFMSESSDAEIKVFHAVCSDGCQSHIMFEDPSIMNFCPNCTSSLSFDKEQLIAEASDDEDDAGDAEGDEDGLSDEELEAALTDDDDDEEVSESGDDEDQEDEPEASGDDEDLEGDDAGDEDAGDEDGEDADASLGDDEDDSEDAPEGGDEDLPVVVASASLSKATSMFRKAIARPGVSLSSDDDMEVFYAQCSSEDCGHHIISQSGEVEACPSCNSAVNTAPKLPSLSESEDEDEDDLGLADGDDEEDMGDDLGDEEDDADEDEPTSESSDEIPGAADPVQAVADVKVEDDAAKVAAQAEADKMASESNDKQDEMIEVKFNSLSTVIDSNNDIEHLDMSYSSAIAGQPTWTAFYKGIPVAKATLDSCSAHADVFNREAFGRTAMVAATNMGIREGLTELGFRGFDQVVSVSKHIESKVEERATALASEMEEANKAQRADLMAALATASVGINRGFWPAISNPLKMELWEALSSVGVANPEVLIDRVFAKCSDEYHKTLLDKAEEIVAKPAEFKEELVAAVSGMSYTAVSSDSSSFEETLSIGTPVPGKVTMESVSSDVEDQDFAERRRRVVSMLGR